MFQLEHNEDGVLNHLDYLVNSIHHTLNDPKINHKIYQKKKTFLYLPGPSPFSSKNTSSPNNNNKRNKRFYISISQVSIHTGDSCKSTTF